MALIRKTTVAVQIPASLYEQAARFEGGKYTPRSVIVTALEEWLAARAEQAPKAGPEAPAAETAVRS